jgi:TM2 domain-containing membrane protein YozV
MSDQQDPYDNTKPTEPLPLPVPLPVPLSPRVSSEHSVPAVLASPPPGWYPDRASGLTRWWDGNGWTEHFGPAATSAPAAPYNPYASYPNRTGGPVVVVPLKQGGIAYLLLILLGGFGAHHFYLNRTGAGVAILVMTLAGWATAIIVIGWFLIAAVWIWQIVDLFLVPTYVRQANDRAYRGLA